MPIVGDGPFEGHELVEAWQISKTKTSQSWAPWIDKAGRLFERYPELTLIAIAQAAERLKREQRLSPMPPDELARRERELCGRADRRQ